MLSCAEHNTTHISAAEVTVNLCTVKAVLLLAFHRIDNSMLMLQEVSDRHKQCLCLCMFGLHWAMLDQILIVLMIAKLHVADSLSGADESGCAGGGQVCGHWPAVHWRSPHC